MTALSRLFHVLLLSAATAFAPAYAQPKTVPVSVAVVQKGAAYDEIRLTGSLTAWRATLVSPRTAGYVMRVNVDEGDRVSEGDVLLELDPTLAGISLDRAEAELTEARVRHREAIRRRDELTGLTGGKAVADTEVARAESDVALYAAGVARLRAALEQEREMLARHSVRAPFSGVIVDKKVETGRWVQPGADLVSLVDIQRLKIEVPVPQEHFAHVTAGAPARVAFDAAPDFTYEGEVARRIPVSDSATRTFVAQIEVDNRAGLLAPGMSARVRVRANQTEDALLLPRDAIVRNGDGAQSVWRAKASGDGVAGENVEVQVGRGMGALVEVRGGVSAGDQVVVHGNESLTPGQALEITEVLQPAS